jgi:O-antigen/teichoic acid export membrane protein
LNLRKQTAQAVAWEGAKFWVGRAFPLLVFLVLARLLAPEHFGLVALATAYIAFFEIFAEQGFAAAIIHRQDLEAEHLDSAFWISAAIGLVLTAVGVATAGLAASLFGEPELTVIVQVLSLNFLILSFQNVQLALLQRELDFRSLAVRTIIGVAVGGVVGIGMAFFGFGVWSLVGQQLTSNLVQVALLWKVSSWRPGRNFSARHARQLLSFGINMTGLRVLRYASNRSDQLLIGYYLTSVALGYYTVAMKLYDILSQLFTRMLANVLFPALSRVQEDQDKLRRGFYLSTRLGSLVAFPGFAGLAILAPELVPALFGSKWDQSIPLMQLLALLGLLEATTFATEPLLMASGLPSWRLGLRFVHSIANVVAFLISVRFGIFWVAAAFTIRGYLMAPVEIWTVRRAAGISLATYLRQFRTPLVAASLMTLVIWLEKSLLPAGPGAWTMLGTYIATGVAVYVLGVFVLEPGLLRQTFSLARLALPGRGKEAPLSSPEAQLSVGTADPFEHVDP